jgi:hypothetical protein
MTFISGNNVTNLKIGIRNTNPEPNFTIAVSVLSFRHYYYYHIILTYIILHSILLLLHHW